MKCIIVHKTKRRSNIEAPCQERQYRLCRSRPKVLWINLKNSPSCQLKGSAKLTFWSLVAYARGRRTVKHAASRYHRDPVCSLLAAQDCWVQSLSTFTARHHDWRAWKCSFEASQPMGIRAWILISLRLGATHHLWMRRDLTEC